MQIANLATLPQAAAKQQKNSRPEPGPDDTSDPDFGDNRRNDDGPDSVYDPDFGGRGGGDTYSGPDGTYSYDPYH